MMRADLTAEKVGPVSIGGEGWGVLNGVDRELNRVKEDMAIGIRSILRSVFQSPTDAEMMLNLRP